MIKQVTTPGPKTLLHFLLKITLVINTKEKNTSFTTGQSIWIYTLQQTWQV